MKRPTGSDDDRTGPVSPAGDDVVVDDADALVDDALRAALVREAPPDFADRVVAAAARRHRPSTLRRGLAVAAGVAVIMSGGFAAGRMTSSSPAQSSSRSVSGVAPDHGRLQATTRTTTMVPGALVVAEPGAHLRWQDGAVHLDDGEAFFRVDPRAPDAGPFTIHTPGGDVVVRGTCFRLRISRESSMPVSQSRLSLPSPGALAGTVAGAIAGVAVTLVMVDEGRVTLANTHGTVDVVAGEQARAQATSRPEKQDAAQVERRRQAAVAALAAVRRDGDDVGQLRVENERLRAVVAAQEEELALLDVDRRAKEGEPRAFPTDLPERFTEGPLRAAFSAAIAEAGVDASVTGVDCAEYPCMVWGRWAGDTRELSETLNATEAFSAYADDRPRVFGWGNNEGPEIFGVALLPPPPPDAPPDEGLLRRINHRAHERFAALNEAEKARAAAQADNATTP